MSTLGAPRIVTRDRRAGSYAISAKVVRELHRRRRHRAPTPLLHAGEPATDTDQTRVHFPDGHHFESVADFRLVSTTATTALAACASTDQTSAIGGGHGHLAQNAQDHRGAARQRQQRRAGAARRLAAQAAAGDLRPRRRRWRFRRAAPRSRQELPV